MYSVVKITEDKIYMLSDDGKIYKTDVSNAKWNVQVGDVIAIHNIENKVVLTKINKEPEVKVKTKIQAGFVKVCQKFLLPIFSVLFAISLVGFFVIALLPHGKTYTCKTNPLGIDIDSTLTLSGDEATIKMVNPIYKNEDYEDIEGFDITSEYLVETFKYKIIDRKLYTLNDDTGKYEDAGDISSTEFVIKGSGVKIEYTEKTMLALAGLSFVSFIVFFILDLVCIVIVIINIKRMLKTVNSTEDSRLSNSQITIKTEDGVNTNMAKENKGNLKSVDSSLK